MDPDDWAMHHVHGKSVNIGWTVKDGILHVTDESEYPTREGFFKLVPVKQEWVELDV